MNSKNFENHLNEQYGTADPGIIRDELGYLISEKKVSEPTFLLYVRQKMVGTMLKRLDMVKFNSKLKLYNK